MGLVRSLVFEPSFGKKFSKDNENTIPLYIFVGNYRKKIKSVIVRRTAAKLLLTGGEKEV